MRHSATRHTRADTRRSICPVLACTRRDSPFHRLPPLRSTSCLRGVSAFLASKRGLRRFITDGGSCRFCVIAVTLATRTCMRLRIWPVGGLSSAAQYVPPSAALSLSHIIFREEDIYSVRVPLRNCPQTASTAGFGDGFRSDRAHPRHDRYVYILVPGSYHWRYHGGE